MRKIESKYSYITKNFIPFSDKNVNSFSRLSLGFAAQTPKRWSHEIEFSYSGQLPPINHNQRITSEHLLESSFYSIQYALSKVLSAQNKYFQFSIGLGLNAYQSKFHNEKSETTTFFSFQEKKRWSNT